MEPHGDFCQDHSISRIWEREDIFPFILGTSEDHAGAGISLEGRQSDQGFRGQSQDLRPVWDEAELKQVDLKRKSIEATAHNPQIAGLEIRANSVPGCTLSKRTPGASSASVLFLLSPAIEATRPAEPFRQRRRGSFRPWRTPSVESREEYGSIANLPSASRIPVWAFRKKTCRAFHSPFFLSPPKPVGQPKGVDWAVVALPWEIVKKKNGVPSPCKAG